MAFAQRLRDNEDRVWRLLFVAAFIGSVCCTIVVLGGLAAVTAYCFDNQPSGIAVGMKTEMVRMGTAGRAREAVEGPGGAR